MSEISSIAGAPQTLHQVVATTTNGKAAFQRLRDGRANLSIQYRVPEIQINNNGGTLPQCIVAACEHEVVIMRKTLTELMNGLAEQLTDVGRAAVVDRIYQYDDERDWKSEEGILRVKETVTEIYEQSVCKPDISERSFVIANISGLIQNRETAIRSVYERIRTDAAASGK